MAPQKDGAMIGPTQRFVPITHLSDQQFFEFREIKQVSQKQSSGSLYPNTSGKNDATVLG